MDRQNEMLSTMTGSLETLDPDELTYRAKLAAGYLVGVQAPDGLFAYEYDFVAGRFRGENHIVRQAGAAFALSEYLGRSHREDVRTACERTLTAVAAFSVPAAQGKLVVGRGELAGTYTGTTALALLCELGYFAATRDTRFETYRKDWLLGLASVQLADGAFAANADGSGRSPFYDGEAWLALAFHDMLFDADPTARRILAKAEEFMMPHYGMEPQVGFLHWGLMAAATRYATTGAPRYVDFITALATTAITSLQADFRPNRNAAYLVEGLSSAAACLKSAGREREPLFGMLVERCRRELGKCFEMQVLPHQRQLVLREGCYIVDPGIAAMAGAVLNGRYQLKARIDFTQHFLSAILRYQEIFAPARFDPRQVLPDSVLSHGLGGQRFREPLHAPDTGSMAERMGFEPTRRF